LVPIFIVLEDENVTTADGLLTFNTAGLPFVVEISRTIEVAEFIDNVPPRVTETDLVEGLFSKTPDVIVNEVDAGIVSVPVTTTIPPLIIVTSPDVALRLKLGKERVAVLTVIPLPEVRDGVLSVHPEAPVRLIPEKLDIAFILILLVLEQATEIEDDNASVPPIVSEPRVESSVREPDSKLVLVILFCDFPIVTAAPDIDNVGVLIEFVLETVNVPALSVTEVEAVIEAEFAIATEVEET
jgi:hypothetical protein